jgi:acetyltransferase-like isoleucine patch superfamily enzyme
MNHTTTALPSHSSPVVGIPSASRGVPQALRRIASLSRRVTREVDAWGSMALTWMPGEIGIAVRVRYFRRRCHAFGIGCRLGPGFRVHHPHGLEIGDRVAANGAQINAKGSVRIGSDCLIADGVKIWSINHRFADPALPIAEQGYQQAPVTIGDDVWLGSNAVVLPGVTIGRGAVIAAGSVVTRDVPDGSVAAGVPAKVVGWRGQSGAWAPPQPFER